MQKNTIKLGNARLDFDKTSQLSIIFLRYILLLIFYIVVRKSYFVVSLI